MRSMFDSGHHIPSCRSVRAQFVGEIAFRRQALLPEQPDQQSIGRPGIAAGLDDLIQNVTVLINGTPKPMFSAADGNRHLIQMPDIFSRRFLFAQLLRMSRSEFSAPSPDRFVRHDDAALQQHFFDQPQAQGDPKIQPDRIRDDLMWKAVVLVTNRRFAHPRPIICQPLSHRQRDIALGSDETCPRCDTHPLRAPAIAFRTRRPKIALKMTIRAAVPRFQIRFIMVASRR